MTLLNAEIELYLLREKRSKYAEPTLQWESTIQKEIC